jgi:hypothetical protein
MLPDFHMDTGTEAQLHSLMIVCGKRFSGLRLTLKPSGSTGHVAKVSLLEHSPKTLLVYRKAAGSAILHGIWMYMYSGQISNQIGQS